MKRRFETGVAAVEFALVLPILVTLVFGVIETSFMLYDKAVITNASREAARAGIVMRQTPLTIAEIQTVALNYCQNYLISLGGGSSTPTVTVSRSAYNSFYDSTVLTVTVTYTYNSAILRAFSSVFGLPMTFSGITVMVDE